MLLKKAEYTAVLYILYVDIILYIYIQNSHTVWVIGKSESWDRYPL